MKKNYKVKKYLANMEKEIQNLIDERQILIDKVIMEIINLKRK